MDPTDPHLERRRLAELYAAMSDGELLKIAEDTDALTEAALQALEAEIDRRELDAEDADGPCCPAAGGLGVRKLVTIRHFRDLPQALLAKGVLDSAGIEAFLGDDNMVRLDWFISNLLGGIKLRVKAEDEPAATALLDQPIPEEFRVEGVGKYLQPHCPKCFSLDVTFEALNKPIAFASAWMGVPVPFPSNTWNCESCGHRWREPD